MSSVGSFYFTNSRVSSISGVGSCVTALLTVSTLDPNFSWMGGTSSCVTEPPALPSSDLKIS